VKWESRKKGNGTPAPTEKGRNSKFVVLYHYHKYVKLSTERQQVLKPAREERRKMKWLKKGNGRKIEKKGKNKMKEEVRK